MSDHRSDEAKGRAKEAAGSATGRDDLKREGSKDRTAASVKKGTDKAKEKVDDATDAITGDDDN